MFRRITIQSLLVMSVLLNWFRTGELHWLNAHLRIIDSAKSLWQIVRRFRHILSHNQECLVPLHLSKWLSLNCVSFPFSTRKKRKNKQTNRKLHQPCSIIRTVFFLFFTGETKERKWRGEWLSKFFSCFCKD